jgi:SAM-dependent methyltransferase
MGLGMDCALYLQRRGYLTPERNWLLDIGPQNVYFANADQIREFVRRQGQKVPSDVLEREIGRLVYFSTPRPGERTTLFSEITDLTNIEYNSIDVCPALKTEILDLNFDPLPEHLVGKYDVILNFGTTEHIFNQWNCFESIHDAMKTGGVVYHQLPASGYLSHGYFCYTPLFFKELAEANDYEILDLFFSPAGLDDLREMKIDLRKEGQYLEPNSANIPPSEARVPSFNIHVIMRKNKDSAFKCGLEIKTAHAGVDSAMAARYGSHSSPALSRHSTRQPIPDARAESQGPGKPHQS